MDYNARYYDPQIQQFISVDTIVPQSGNVLSWNRYAYVNNNPIMYNDPSGHKNKISQVPDETNPNDGYDWIEDAVYALDIASVVVSGGEAILADGLSVAIVGIGCFGGAETGGLTCGISITLALAVDNYISSPAGAIGAIENSISIASFAGTFLSDDENMVIYETMPTNYIENFTNEIEAIYVGKDTIVSTRNMLFGLTPESNIDFAVSISQLVYDNDRRSGDKINEGYQVWGRSGDEDYLTLDQAAYEFFMQAIIYDWWWW